MTVDEMIETLEQVKKRYGGETTIAIETFVSDEIKTYDLNKDWLKVHEKPFRYGGYTDNVRYLSLCLITKGQYGLKFDSKYSKLCVQNV